jgi:hypothetical protein
MPRWRRFQACAELRDGDLCAQAAGQGTGTDRARAVPTHKPCFWNWVLRASPGVHATLVREIGDARGRDVGAVVNLDEQFGSGLGESRLLLGCSTAVPKITAA